MGKKLSVLFVISFTLFFITGCMFPEEKRSQNKIPYEDQVQSVQTAVDRFQEDNGGIIPIKNSEEKTPIFQKYLIDFKKLVPKYIAEPPGNAYESGGVFQYVIVHAETEPTVKLFDLRTAELLSEINMRLKVQGYPPFKDKIMDNIYTLDFKRLGYNEAPFVVSPYSNQNLPLVINGAGEIYIDYRTDLMEKLKSTSHKYKPGDDIRYLLLEDSPFVPAYSLPYTIDNTLTEPIFFTN